MTRQDLKVVDNAIIISNNDVQWANSDEQHIQDTINSFAGWWKENPLDGVGIFSFLKSKGKENMVAKDIKLQLSSDGYIVSNPQVNFDRNGILIIKPNATR